MSDTTIILVSTGTLGVMIGLILTLVLWFIINEHDD